MGGEGHHGEGRACGKLILLGEHAVVYGQPALAVGIERGLVARAWGSDGHTPGLELLGRRSSADPELARAFSALCAATERPAPARLRVEVRGDLTPGVGLGFSAAAAVAIARAVEALAGGPPDVAVVAERAMAWERVFHGNPSGVDTAAALHGGCIRFTRAGGPLPFAPRHALELCVGMSGATASTAEMVERVAAARRAHPTEEDAAIARIGGLVERAVGALRSGDLDALGAAMSENATCLARWGLATPAIDALCRTALEAGALGAKLSGSGGGGVVVALAGRAREGGPSDCAARIVEAWRTLGLDGFRTVVAGGTPEEA